MIQQTILPELLDQNKRKSLSVYLYKRDNDIIMNDRHIYVHNLNGDDDSTFNSLCCRNLSSNGKTGRTAS